MSQEESLAGQYLTFLLNGETFGIAIERVLEVLDSTDITCVPQAPEYLRGVINLRGSIVPVVDLHCKFGLPPSQRTLASCIIIVEVKLDGENTSLGALADSVQEVIDLEEHQIEAAPRMGTRLNSDYLRGMGKQGERFITLLNIDSIFVQEPAGGERQAS
ncbi:MAG: chemotaxis protein CheW [Desulfuromonas sp.]|jgi:purine-binding chemotaxis protein CheW|nr:chemotaxis protein CheW [Desulfuromonas thiophila]